MSYPIGDATVGSPRWRSWFDVLASREGPYSRSVVEVDEVEAHRGLVVVVVECDHQPIVPLADCQIPNDDLDG